MVVETVMFFALGFLSAALIAMGLGRALWNRAVRLTRKRIEAATPVTLNEFRADKDTLRAAHAVAIRKLEMRNDMLRDKLAALVRIVDAKATETDALKAERDEQFEAIKGFQDREHELVERIRDLERDSAALAARVRQSEADFAQLPEIGDSVPSIGEEQLSGDYRADVEDLLTALSIERQRNGYLEDQARMLLTRLEKSRSGAFRDDAVSVLRDALDANSDPQSAARVELHKAETRISSAEMRLNALLGTTGHDEPDDGPDDHHLAEELSSEAGLETLKAAVLTLEHDVTHGDQDDEHLRARLGEIAAMVSSAVYDTDAQTENQDELSLFDRVLKFSDDTLEGEHLEPETRHAPGRVSARMAALRDMQLR